MGTRKTLTRVPELLLRWLIDSGASGHVLPEDFVRNNREHVVDHIRPTEHGCAFETANGLVKPDECVDAWVKQLRKKLEFIIVKACQSFCRWASLSSSRGYLFTGFRKRTLIWRTIRPGGG